MDTFILLILVFSVVFFLYKKYNNSQEGAKNERQGHDTKQKTNCLVIDTETSGLDSKSEVIQLSMLDNDGREIFDSLIRPFGKIPREVIAIHNITNEMVQKEDVPTIVHAIMQILQYVRENFPDNDFTLVGYNTSFDTKMIIQSLSIAEKNLLRKSDKTFSKEEKQHLPEMIAALIEFVSVLDGSSRCIMREFQAFKGYHRWVKLIDAANESGVEITDAHSAKGDCLMTIGVMNYIDQHK
ncbi:TPA: 3'-5' exonuclease [Photobacterium damselae]